MADIYTRQIVWGGGVRPAKRSTYTFLGLTWEPKDPHSLKKVTFLRGEEKVFEHSPPPPCKWVSSEMVASPAH